MERVREREKREREEKEREEQKRRERDRNKERKRVRNSDKLNEEKAEATLCSVQYNTVLICSVVYSSSAEYLCIFVVCRRLHYYLYDLHAISLPLPCK